MDKNENREIVLTEENRKGAKARRLVFAYSLTTVAAILAGIALRTISLVKYYDKEIGYFKSDAVLPTIFHIFCVCFLIFGLTALLSFAKNSFDTPLCEKSLFYRASSILCAFILGADLINSIGQIAGSASSSTLDTIRAFLCVLGIIYFAAGAMTGKTKGTARVLLGYGTIFYIALTLAKSYFDFYTTMNSPNKLLLQITFMFIMLFLLCESRAFLGISMPRAHFAEVLLTAFFSFVCSVPTIASYIMGIFTNKEYLVPHVICFGFGVYSLSHLWSFIKAK